MGNADRHAKRSPIRAQPAEGASISGTPSVRLSCEFADGWKFVRVAPKDAAARKIGGEAFFRSPLSEGRCILPVMSAREIIEELPHLTGAELREIERRSGELSAKRGAGLNAKRIAGRLVLTGDRVIRQAEVDALLDELPGGVCSMFRRSSRGSLRATNIMPA